VYVNVVGPAIPHATPGNASNPTATTNTATKRNLISAPSGRVALTGNEGIVFGGRHTNVTALPATRPPTDGAVWF